MRNLKSLFFSLTILSSCGLSADVLPFNTNYNDGLLPRSSISYSTGWRNDRFNIKENYFTPEGLDAGPDKTKYKSVDIWEVGVQATLAIPGCYTECGWDWLNQFYLDGYAYWGTVAGKGTRDFKAIDSESGLLGASKRNIRAGNTYDYQIALGWLYPISCELGLAPIAGYSWDKQVIRPSTLRSFEVTSAPSSGVGFHSEHKWKGPFLGVELVYDLCDWRFNAGYEYHWVKADFKFIQSKFDVDVANCVTRTRSSHKNGQHGNVGYLGLSYDICDCWALKLQGKYRDFSSGTSRESDSPELPVDCGFIKAKQDWRSWEVTFDIAYQF